MIDVCIKSQGLKEVPESVLDSKVEKLNLDFNDIAILPACLFENLSSLTYLSINGNLIETLPSSLGQLTKLTELYLKENSLISLPESITELINLEKLYITGNQIKCIPEEIHKLNNLTELIADENEIRNLPISFGNLKSLLHLSLSCNAVESLPENFGNLKKLKKLDLSNNCLKMLPFSFQDLTSLEVLDLNNNRIKLLPDKFLAAKSLKKLLMNQNLLEAIPSWFSDLESVTDIFLSDNKLQGAPFLKDFGCKCSNLEELDLSGNNISALPESIGMLEKLKFLDLGSSFDELERNRMISNGNELVYLPKSFCYLKNISKLELDENQLRELPTDFGLLSNLVYLDLSHNLFKSLPDSFGQLLNLKVCMLSMNDITHLPNNFGSLKALEDLKLDNNLLLELPESFEDLTTLMSLDLYNNCLKEIPKMLNKLKFLKHLDLRENDFGIMFEEVPGITSEPTYPARDPELLNNWRGRKRPDILPDSWVEKKETYSSGEPLISDIMYNAMKCSASLWRKHGQSSSRIKSSSADTPVTNGFNHSCEDGYSDELSERAPSNISTSEQENDQEAEKLEGSSMDQFTIYISNDTEYWDEHLSSNASDGNSSVSSLDNASDFKQDSCSSSDWESDSDLNLPNNFKKIYRHPVENVPFNINILIPSDSHVKSVQTKFAEIWSPAEEGQFEDAESS